MTASVGVRELRQNLSRYLDRVKGGESLVVTEHGREVARLIPSAPDGYAELAERFGATIPVGRLEDIVDQLDLAPTPAGATDEFLRESRRDRDGY